jgi:hypothetical protein
MEVSLTHKMNRKERRRLMKVTGATLLKPKERSLVREALRNMGFRPSYQQVVDFQEALKAGTLLPQPEAPSPPA